jgi:hypothetical protein
VYVDNAITGKTPVDLKFEDGKKVTVSFELEGHALLKKVITPSKANPAAIAVKLKKLPGKPVRPPKPEDKLPLCPPRNPDVPRDPLLKCREK